jgi:hypothetical protein
MYLAQKSLKIGKNYGAFAAIVAALRTLLGQQWAP